MADLRAFIEARLTEDEETAQRAGHDSPEWTYDRETFTVRSGRWAVAARKESDGRIPINDVDGEHMARHDPARVLREVVAKRALLALHVHLRFREPLDAASPHEEDHRPAFLDEPRYVGCERCNWDPRHEEVYPSWWCETIRLLAAPWSDHPEYRTEWARSAPTSTPSPAAPCRAGRGERAAC